MANLTPSDDWPYLYLPSRGVSGFYLSVMAILAALSVVAILSASRDLRASVLTRKGVDLEMFLYGFAFLLIETKFVTTMNLVWGATWLTSAVVFGSILAVILLGTVVTNRRPIPWQWAGVGLTIGLLAVYALPAQLMLSTSPAVRLGLSAMFVGAPVLCASLCFADRFRARPAADTAFGWNLLGAVLGGLTEFLSMAFGLRALTLIALLAYLVAFAVARREAVHAAAAPLADA